MPKLTLYARKDCCLCDEMKIAIDEVSAKIIFELETIDVDMSPALQEQFGAQVPVLFIDGRKVFKYRVTTEQLARRLTHPGRFRFAWRGFGSNRT